MNLGQRIDDIILGSENKVMAAKTYWRRSSGRRFISCQNTCSVVKCCFRWTWFWSPHEVFCSYYIYGRCWSRIRMMPSWHPWGNWVICKLGRPLPKFHFWVITRVLYKINERLWCLHLGFRGQWFWLDHCREDPAICICIIMQIMSAITEIASVYPN